MASRRRRRPACRQITLASFLSFSTSVANYEQALELMDRYGCTLTEQVRGRLKLSLGVAMKRAGQRGSRTLMFEAAEIAAACGDSPTVVQAALANTRGFFSSAGRTDQDRVRLLELALELRRQRTQAGRRVRVRRRVYRGDVDELPGDQRAATDRTDCRPRMSMRRLP